MADAKQAGGLYYRPDGTATDAEGKVLEGAPKREPDTDPSKQPGSLGAQTPEERIGVAIATALRTGGAAPAATAKPSKAPKGGEPDTDPSKQEQPPKGD